MPDRAAILETVMTETPMQRALSCFASQTQMALEMEVSVAYVNKLLKTGRVPPGRAVQIEELVEGKVTRHELCPGWPRGKDDAQ